MRILILVAMAIVAGCASQPQSQQSPAPAVAPAPEAAPAPAPQQTVAVNDAGKRAFKPPVGYKTRKSGNATVYCKTDTILGSRFPEEFCFTEDQLEDVIRRGDDQRMNKTQQSGLCTGGGPCGGN